VAVLDHQDLAVLQALLVHQVLQVYLETDI
jgi:hypothetical protein